MSLTHSEHSPVRFSPERLAAVADEAAPWAVFALLHGSAHEGYVGSRGDIDLAFFAPERVSVERFGQLMKALSTVVPEELLDIGFLREAEPVYRFEALKGRLLFCRDMGRYAAFFSLTCREYEEQMQSYARQRRYRLLYGIKSEPSPIDRTGTDRPRRHRR